MTAPIFGVLFLFFYVVHCVLFSFYVYLLSDAVWLYGKRIESRSAIQVGQYRSYSYKKQEPTKKRKGKRKKTKYVAAFALVFRAVPIRWRVVNTHPSLHLPCICITFFFLLLFIYIFFLLTNPVRSSFGHAFKIHFFSSSSFSLYSFFFLFSFFEFFCSFVRSSHI